MTCLHPCFSLSQFCLFFYFSWFDPNQEKRSVIFGLENDQMKNKLLSLFFRLFRLKTLLTDKPLLPRRDQRDQRQQFWCLPTGCRSCGQPGCSSSPSFPLSYLRVLRAWPTDGTIKDTLIELLTTWEIRERQLEISV